MKHTGTEALGGSSEFMFIAFLICFGMLAATCLAIHFSYYKPDFHIIGRLFSTTRGALHTIPIGAAEATGIMF